MERRKDLDFAKGIGIILMVLGHCFSEGNGEGIRLWFYSFHMPLFFIIPGILARSQSVRPTFSVFLKKRARGLMLPYFIWGVIAAVYLTVMGRKPVAWMLTLLKCVVSFEGLSAMWFLPCLFLAELLFRFCLDAAARSKWLGHAVAAVLALLGYGMPTFSTASAIVLRSFTGASFLYLGWVLADLLNRPCKISTWFVLCAAQVLLSRINGQISVLGREYGNIALFYLNALLGSWLMIRLYHVVVSVRWNRIAQVIVWFGKNSLIVVCTGFCALDILRLVDYKLFGSILPTLGSIEGIILCFLTMGLEAIAITFCGRYLWFTFGKQNPNKVQAIK